MRNATEFDGPIVIHALTQKGRGLPAGRGRRREAPPRRAGVRPRGRAAQGGAHRLHAGLRRVHHQGGRAGAAPRRHHGRHARADGPAPLPRPLPGPLLRRRDRGAARRHRRGRHGDGWAAPRRGPVLDVPQPGLGPGGLRRRPPPAAGPVRAGPCRHHRRRRRQPSRRVRPGAALPRAGDDRAGTVVGPGPPADAARRRRPDGRGPGGHPLPEGSGPPGPGRSGRVRAARPPGAGRGRPGVPAGRRQAGGQRREGGAAAGGRRHRRHGVGRPLLRPAGPRDDRRRRPPPAWSSPARTASATAAWA